VRPKASLIIFSSMSKRDVFDLIIEHETSDALDKEVPGVL
jgi:hypothetical protein